MQAGPRKSTFESGVYWAASDTRALLPPGAPGEGGLTSGRGTGVQSAVHLPPCEARADLAGLVVRNPGF